MSLVNGFAIFAFFWILSSRKTETIAAFYLLILPVERAGPLLPINTGIAKLIMTAVLFMATKTKRNYWLNIDHQKFGGLLILLSVIHWTAFLRSDDKLLSFQYISYFSTSILVFFIFYGLLSRSLLKKSLNMLLLSTYAACGIGIMQYLIITYNLTNPLLLSLVPDEIKLYWIESAKNMAVYPIRITSFFFHSNGFGHFLSVIFSFNFSMFLVVKKRKERFLYFIAVVCVLISCLLTLSRGSAMVITVEGLAILIFFRKDVMNSRFRVAAIGFCFLLVGYFAIGPNLFGFLDRIRFSGLANREINWEYAMQLIPRHFLFGVGPGMCSYHMLCGFPFPADYLERLLIDLTVEGRINWYISHAHNFYLNTLIETGIFSLIVYLILIWTIIRKGVSLFIECRHAMIKALVAALLAPILGGLLRGLFESYVFFSSSYVGYYLSFCMAFILYLDNLQQRRYQNNGNPRRYSDMAN